MPQLDETMKIDGHTDCKVLVIGLDGAAWSVINNLIQRGELQTFQKLIEHGVYGCVESTIPPWTIPAWNALTTGLNPGKLGFSTFTVKTNKDFKPYYFVIKDPKRNLWDILSVMGKKVIIANLPNIYSAYRINGVMISGFLNTDEFKVAYPPSLLEELDRIAGGYVVDVTKLIDPTLSSDGEYYRKEISILRKHHEVFKHLLKEYPWDFAFLVYAEPDRVQHRFWGDERVLSVYRMLDVMLSELLTIVDKNTCIFIISDHGFGVGDEKILFINEWLAKSKYLYLKKNLKRDTFVRLINIIKKLGLQGLVEFTISTLPSRLKAYLRKEANFVKSSGIVEQTDWEKTKALGYGVFGDIWLNVDDSVEYEITRNKLINELKKEFGEGLKIYKKEEIYNGPHTEKLPDLIILVDDEHINAISPHIAVESIKPTRGNHRLYGIFIASGIGIKNNYRIENIKIYDLFSTLLHLFNLPIPGDVDGRVLMEIFEPGSKFAKRKPEYVDLVYYKKKQEGEKLRQVITGVKLHKEE